MDSLLPLAQKVGEKLKARKETIGISESSAGGLVSAALLAVPGASAYFMGGAVVYTRPAGDAFLAVPREKHSPRFGQRASSQTVTSSRSRSSTRSSCAPRASGLPLRAQSGRRSVSS